MRREGIREGGVYCYLFSRANQLLACQVILKVGVVRTIQNATQMNRTFKQRVRDSLLSYQHALEVIGVAR